MNQIISYNFFGLKVSQFSREELIDFIYKFLKSKNSYLIYGYSLGIIPMIKKYPKILTATKNADIFLSDGRWFYVLCKKSKIPLKYEISIPKFIYLLLKIANTNNNSIFLLGADKNTNALACQNLSREYANINIYGHHGYFNEDEESKIINNIKNINPDIILIGINSPKKEILGKKLKDLGIGKIIIPCGGMLDVLAGKIKPMPKFIKRLGLGSIYRLIQEPKRLLKRYIIIYLYSIVIIPKMLFYIFIKKNFETNIFKFDNENY